MPAGYAATTNMESVWAQGREATAELSDLRIIERPTGQAQPPSNIVIKDNDFDLYFDIHFVGAGTVNLPDLDVYAAFYLEGYGDPPGDFNVDMQEVLPDINPSTANNWTYSVRVQYPDPTELGVGVYKVGAMVNVHYASPDPATPGQLVMSGFIVGAPLQIRQA